MTARPYPHGVDCAWLASDRDGRIGAFVTGGVGPIPSRVLDSDQLSVEEIEQRIHALPRVSPARLLVAMKRPDDFVDMAERGLFAYDWADVHRPTRDAVHSYELIAVPLNPVALESLPAELGALVADVRFDLSWQLVNALDPRQHLSCRGGG